MKAVIIAGGRGTRMGKLSQTTPKALIKIAGKPLLQYQLELLKSQGFKQILILTNHLAEKIQRFCGNGSKFGVSINCVKEDSPMRTAGAVKLIEKYLTTDFLVIYGDEMMNVDFSRLLKFHNQQKKIHKNLAGTVVVHPNDHPLDSNLVEVSQANLVKKFLTKPHPQNKFFQNLASTPVYILTPKIFKYIGKNVPTDFGRQIFPKVLKQGGALAAYKTPEYIKDIGTPGRLKEVSLAVKSGQFAKSSLKTKRPAIFLDRDGVINKEVGDLHRLQDLELLPGAAEAVKKINRSGFYAVVITNQPAVAKGFCSFDYMLEIHRKLETLLGRSGAYLDRLYFCPHHPEKGFAGENKKYKIVCNCRKPKTKMIRDAVHDLNIDLDKSVFVGDRTSDAELARRVGIKFIGVKTGDALADGHYKLVNKPLMVKNIQVAVDKIVGK
jgi:histidinol-phosphate phosphatase family protein